MLGASDEEYLSKECRLGRLMGPFNRDSPQHRSSHITLRGHTKEGKRYVAANCRPIGTARPDGIAKEVSSLSYVTVDHIAERLAILGQGSLVDIKSAFRVIPDDRPLLGMMWNESIYIDSVLPFGLRTVPKLFNAVADALHYIAHKEGINDNYGALLR